MKRTILAFQMRLRLITSFLNGLDINAITIKAHQDFGREGLGIYEKFRNQINDPEKFKELSPIEQQTVMANARNYSEVLTELQQEVQYLMNTRQSLAVQDCLLHITASNMLFDKLIELLGGDDGRLKYPALKHIREKSWEKAKYTDQAYNLATEIDLFIEDYGEFLNKDQDTSDYDKFSNTLIALLNQIYVSLVQSLAWLSSESERVEKEGMPKAREFKLPEVAVPKLPDKDAGKKDQPEDSK